MGILEYAERIDPEIVDPELAGEVNGVLESERQSLFVNMLLPLDLLVYSQYLWYRYAAIAPAIA